MLFLGIDVSKDKLDCAAVSESSGAMLGRRSFPNTADGIARLVRWAEKLAGSGPAGTHALLEATAADHELAAHELVAAGRTVSVVNPAWVRSVARGVAVLGKTDQLDAIMLALRTAGTAQGVASRRAHRARPAGLARPPGRG